MLGARKLATTCQELQRCADAGDLSAASSTLRAADRDLEALRHRFEELALDRAA